MPLQNLSVWTFTKFLCDAGLAMTEKVVQHGKALEILHLKPFLGWTGAKNAVDILPDYQV